MNIRRAHEIINAYTVAFFARYLTGESRLLIDGRTPSPYEEVTVAARNIATAEQRALTQRLWK